MTCFRKVGGKLRRKSMLSKLKFKEWEQIGLFDEEQQVEDI